MKTSFVIVVLFGMAVRAGAEDKATAIFNFDADKPGQAPKGCEFGRTGEGAPGKWVVQAQSDSPRGGNVLVQMDTDGTDNRFPIAYTGPEMKDFRLLVKCKPVSGKVD